MDRQDPPSPDATLPLWGKPIDTVVVLGAGASKNYKPKDDAKNSTAKKDGFPLDADFFDRAFQPNEEARDVANEFGKLHAFLEYFFPDAGNSGCQGSKWPGLEEAYTLIETFRRWLEFAAENRTHPNIRNEVCAFFPPLPYLPFAPVLNQQINPPDRSHFPHAYFKYDVSALVEHQRQIALALISEELKEKKLIGSFESLQHSLESVRRQLDELVYRVLARSHVTEEDGTCSPCELHTTLFKSIINGNEKDEHKGGMAVLSFNYDLVADSSLARALENTRRWKWNAETFYLQLFDPTPYLVEKPDNKTNQNIFLLKLHGSLNWYNSTVTDRFVCGQEDGRGPRVLSEEELTTEYLEPVFIPAVADKFLELEKTRAGNHGRSWTVALDSLLKAKKWIFIGYSLPPTDFHANWLFRMAASYRMNICCPPEIEIVNPDKETNLKKMLNQVFGEETKSKERLKEYCCLREYLDKSRPG